MQPADARDGLTPRSSRTRALWKTRAPWIECSPGIRRRSLLSSGGGKHRSSTLRTAFAGTARAPKIWHKRPSCAPFAHCQSGVARRPFRPGYSHLRPISFVRRSDDHHRTRRCGERASIWWIRFRWRIWLRASRASKGFAGSYGHCRPSTVMCSFSFISTTGTYCKRRAACSSPREPSRRASRVRATCSERG